MTNEEPPPKPPRRGCRRCCDADCLYEDEPAERGPCSGAVDVIGTRLRTEEGANLVGS